MQAILAVQSIGDFTISENLFFFCLQRTEQLDGKDALDRKRLKGKILQMFIEMLQKKLSKQICIIFLNRN